MYLELTSNQYLFIHTFSICIFFRSTLNSKHIYIGPMKLDGGIYQLDIYLYLTYMFHIRIQSVLYKIRMNNGIFHNTNFRSHRNRSSHLNIRMKKLINLLQLSCFFIGCIQYIQYYQVPYSLHKNNDKINIFDPLKRNRFIWDKHIIIGSNQILYHLYKLDN